MPKFMHRAVLVSIVLICAIVSALTVHTLLTLTGFGVRDQSSRSAAQDQAGSRTTLTPSPQVYLTKDASGVYTLPTINPTYPLQLGSHTVGGVTACERLYNLGNCLKDKKSPLLSKLRTPEASAGAGLESVCGGILNDLAYLRPQTAQIDCVW